MVTMWFVTFQVILLQTENNLNQDAMMGYLNLRIVTYFKIGFVFSNTFIVVLSTICRFYLLYLNI
jgi:hypothetical protein